MTNDVGGDVSSEITKSFSIWSSLSQKDVLKLFLMVWHVYTHVHDSSKKNTKQSGCLCYFTVDSL